MQARIVRLLGLGACIVGIFVALIVVQRFAADAERSEARGAGDPSGAAGRSVAEKPARRAGRRCTRPAAAGARCDARRHRSRVHAAAGSRPAQACGLDPDHEAGVKPDGSIVGEGGTVRLYGVTFPEPKQICRRRIGRELAVRAARLHHAPQQDRRRDGELRAARNGRSARGRLLRRRPQSGRMDARAGSRAPGADVPDESSRPPKPVREKANSASGRTRRTPPMSAHDNELVPRFRVVIHRDNLTNFGSKGH